MELVLLQEDEWSVIKNNKSVYVAQVKHILNFPNNNILGNCTQLTLNKLAWHNSL